MLSGKSNKEIADSLFLSPRTVETHLYSIYRKTGVPNRLALFAQVKTYKTGVSV